MSQNLQDRLNRDGYELLNRVARAGFDRFPRGHDATGCERLPVRVRGPRHALNLKGRGVRRTLDMKGIRLTRPD